ncbi:MAG: hypothetical protein JJU13_21090 [Balneolaceae bacterium]|jgi:hypothetical protein|nr:hypothetical protein [Balneolaceae bacterium]
MIFHLSSTGFTYTNDFQLFYMTITLVLHQPAAGGWQKTIASFPDDFSCEIIWQKKDIHETVTDERVKLSTPLPYSDTESNIRFNYAMAMLYSSDGLIVENPSLLSFNFSHYLDEVKKALSTERYIISLGSDLYFKDTGNIELIDLPVYQLSETRALFFDPVTKTELATWILQGMTLPEKGYKDAIKSYCNEFDIPLFVLNYSLVQNLPDQKPDPANHDLYMNFIDDFKDVLSM